MTARRLATFTVMAAALAMTVSPPAHAERIVASVSSHRVTVNTNYVGEELVVFGTMEADADTPAATGAQRDLVITVSGPRADMTTWRKERRLGIWLNTDSRQFLQVPEYLAVFSNRPLSDIASPDLRRRLQLGIDNVQLTQRVGPDYADVVATDSFRIAFVRRQTERGLYWQSASAVTFLTPTLFRASITLPGRVPIGTYEVDVKLFADNTLIGRTKTSFDIVKTGFEQFVASTAKTHGVLYGLATVLMALATCWIAALAFRKD